MRKGEELVRDGGRDAPFISLFEPTNALVCILPHTLSLPLPLSSSPPFSLFEPTNALVCILPHTISPSPPFPSLISAVFGRDSMPASCFYNYEWKACQNE